MYDFGALLVRHGWGDENTCIMTAQAKGGVMDIRVEMNADAWRQLA